MLNNNYENEIKFIEKLESIGVDFSKADKVEIGKILAEYVSDVLGEFLTEARNRKDIEDV